LETDALSLAVVMQRRPLKSRWQPYQWQPAEVVVSPWVRDGAPRCLHDDPSDTRWLFTGFELRLYSDESEGYFLNLDSRAPCWFVMWRMDEAGELAVPQVVTLSYNEAARMMDGGELVDTLPAPAFIVRQLESFVQEFYRPEPKRKRRKPSFEGGSGVQQMAEQEVMRRGR
jgi:hypothetical protein